MRFLEEAITAAAVAVFFVPALAAEPADVRYAALAGLAPGERLAEQGRVLEFDVDLAASPGYSIEVSGGRARLVEPLIGESTKFWKATHAQPVDFTLKKRYLLGVLEEVDFVDRRADRVVCRILPGREHCTVP